MKLYYIFCAILLVALFSCTKKPTACFTVSSTEVETGDTIFFTNCSENAEFYDWGFGDGFTSEDKNPSHAYTIIGDFTAWLSASSENLGKNSYVSTIIKVTNSRDKFLGSYSIIDNCTVSQGTATLDIKENPSLAGSVLIDNIFEGFQDVLANVSSNNIVIPQQLFIDTVQNYTMYIDGSGSLNGNILSMSYTVFQIPDSITYNCTPIYKQI
ncbi:MAG: hypothetical protein COC01_09830 [Bacteroidetes bacterium]|nr:MAG: hypothetical protein COC01_09830 [Bacteroidota bacterium]